MSGRTLPYRLKRHGLGQVRGSEHPAAKLDDAAVLWLRLFAREFRDLDLTAAARRMGYRVSPAALSRAVHGDNWTHLPYAVRRDRRFRARRKRR